MARKRNFHFKDDTFDFPQYTQDNFMKSTKVDFKSCRLPKGKPDYVSNSGSRYWYFDEKVIRESTHWGLRSSACCWTLNNKRIKNNRSVGEAYWCDFEHNKQIKKTKKPKDVPLEIESFNVDIEILDIGGN